MDRISINGRFLTQPLTGVQRFARELTHALDRKIGAGTLPASFRGTQWRILVPEGSEVDIDLTHIKLERRGRGAGHLWEQTTLARATRGDILVGFGGSGPLLHPRQLVVIHDVTIFRHPEAFGRGYRALHKLLGFVLTRRAQVATVSQFSRRELGAVFGVPSEGIAVIYNAPDHFAATVPDPSIMARLGLAERGFFVLVGTLKPNKNVDFAVRAFRESALPGQKLVIVGGIHGHVFKGGGIAEADDLIFAGRLSDAEVAGLERHATAFVFPSLYEGFGIPPLEAMTQDCPVLAADIPAVREACGEATLYFDPRSGESLKGAMRAILAEPGQREALVTAGHANLARFSWEKSAESLLSILAGMRSREA